MTDWAAFPRDVAFVLLLIFGTVALVYAAYLIVRRL
jgi:hypothetical protein